MKSEVIESILRYSPIEPDELYYVVICEMIDECEREGRSELWELLEENTRYCTRRG